MTTPAARRQAAPKSKPAKPKKIRAEKGKSGLTPTFPDRPIGYGNPPRETQIQKGEVLNPGGVPKVVRQAAVLLSTAYAQKLAQLVPGDEQGRTYAEAVATGQIKAAAKGQTQAATEIRKATEGELLRFSAMSDDDLIKLLTANAPDARATAGGADAQGAGATAPAGVSSAADAAQPDGE